MISNRGRVAVVLVVTVAMVCGCGRSKAPRSNGADGLAIADTSATTSAADAAIFKAADWYVARDQSWPAEASTLLGERDFASVDELANRYRAIGRDTDGSWALRQFYEVLRHPGVSDDASWSIFLERIEEWKASRPNSIPARVALGAALVEYAWFARGGGWANTVTDDGARKMKERLGRARASLEEALRMDSALPDAHYYMTGVALGEGWSREAREALFLKATSIEPDDYWFYLDYASFLLPRWYGDEDDWEEFTRRILEERGDTIGAELYARMCWLRFQGGDKIFENGDAEWSTMRSGFRSMMDRWPTSRWNLNSFAYFACVNGDRETAHELLEQIGDDPIMGVWQERDYLRKCQSWAGLQGRSPASSSHAPSTP